VNAYVPGPGAVKLTLAVQGPAQLPVRGAPGMVKPMSCGTERSWFVSVTVTLDPADTVNPPGAKAKFCARTLRLAGPDGRGAGGSAGGAGFAGAAGAGGCGAGAVRGGGGSGVAVGSGGGGSGVFVAVGSTVGTCVAVSTLTTRAGSVPSAAVIGLVEELQPSTGRRARNETMTRKRLTKPPTQEERPPLRPLSNATSNSSE
jgi:hypothetical protein